MRSPAPVPARGHRRPEEQTPRLAGQPRLYLHKQLDDFASGDQCQREDGARRPLTRRRRSPPTTPRRIRPASSSTHGEPSLVQEGERAQRSVPRNAAFVPAKSAMLMRCRSRRAFRIWPVSNSHYTESSAASLKAGARQRPAERSWPIAAARLEREGGDSGRSFTSRVRPATLFPRACPIPTVRSLSRRPRVTMGAGLRPPSACSRRSVSPRRAHRHPCWASSETR